MSESKYSPPVNMPENVPGNPENVGSLTCIFLHSSGQWIGVNGTDLMLYQVEEDKIGLGQRLPDEKFRSFVIFPGKLVPKERKVVVP